MGPTNKDLLDLEKLEPSSIESKVLVCNNDPFSQNKRGRIKGKSNGNLFTTPMPTSSVLGKLKDFLGVMAEANKKLQLDTQETSPGAYDIEVLSENETQYIEMDLALGVADLHTPEAIAAAESAMAGCRSAVSPIDSDSSLDPEDDDDDDSVCSPNKSRKPNLDMDDRTENVGHLRKRPKITELD